MAQTKLKDRIIIFAPRESEPERAIHLILSRIAGVKIGKGSLHEALASKEAKALVFYAHNRSLLRSLLRAPVMGESVLKGKLVYNLGGLPRAGVRGVIGKGVAGYIGHAQHLWLPVPVPDTMRDALVCGIEALAKGVSCIDVYEQVKSAYARGAVRSLAEMTLSAASSQSEAFLEKFMTSTALLQNMNSLYRFGGEQWRICQRPQIVLLTTDVCDRILKHLEIVDFTPAMIRLLGEDPERMSRLTAEEFEGLVANRLYAMGFEVARHSPTLCRDGGIDLFAWRKDTPFPPLIAVQVKQKRNQKQGDRLGVSVVREFWGAIANQPIDIGLIVTNARFTPSAKWLAKNVSKIIRLRGFDDLKRWLLNDFTDLDWSKDFPESLTLAEDLRISIPWSLGTT